MLAKFLLALAVTVLPAASFAANSRPAHEPPAMRLGDDVRPVAYELSLTLDPQRPQVPGHIEIEIDVAHPLDFFWMNGTQLAIRKAQVTVAGRVLPARVSTAGEDFIGLQFAHTLPAGRARLAIDYTAQVSSNATVGIFRQQDLGQWYDFTQFESHYARRAFPCFDEPQWKTPWTVTLTVRRDHVAVANTPQVAERKLSGGLKEVRFARTAPLPSYLIAFGVGPFDVVDGGTAGVKKTPLRYIVPKGRGSQVVFAREATPKLLELLEDYFGIPYPFEKLDSLAIPVTVAFGAMENPGLITYRGSIVAAPPEMANERFKEEYAAVAAHEMAHQWFGDLVTMQWWDDIWLNESFATWMERKIVPRFNPQWETGSERQQERYEAFDVDRLASSRQVRQPVNTTADLTTAFDHITYDKGGAVLTMFEEWLGEAGFRDGVRAYLNAHANGNATAHEFFAAVGQHDPQVARAFSSFVTQPGLPMVDFELDCTGPQPVVTLRQHRFLPAAAQSQQAMQWLIPVCLRHEGADQPVCTMLTANTQRMALPKAAQCPAWIVPNPRGNGYYLWHLDDRSMRALPAAPLQSEEAMALMTDESMLMHSGALPLARMLELAARLAGSPQPETVMAAASAVADVNLAMLDDAGRAALGSWVHEHFGERAAQLGWLPRPGESDAARKLRAELLPLAADLGGDADLRSQARTLAIAWLGGDRARIGAAYRAVLNTAARFADAPTLAAFLDTAGKSADPATRTEIYRALGHVRDAALRRRAFDYALTQASDPREGREVFAIASQEPDSADALLAFVRERFSTFAARLPEQSLIEMPRWHQSLCSPDARGAVQALYASSKLPGTQQNLQQTLETIDICVRGRALQSAGSATPKTGS
jgi:alanyl aminopeptidase